MKKKLLTRFFTCYFAVLVLGMLAFLLVYIPAVDRTIATNAAEMHMQTEALREYRWTLIRSGLFLTLLFDLFTLIIPLCFGYNCYGPLMQAVSLSSAGLTGKISRKVNPPKTTELYELTGNIIAMSDAINDSTAIQQNFLSNISHDFRSPLTNIRGYTLAMLDGTIEREDQAKYLKIILDMTDRLTHMTDDIVSVNRLNSSQMVLYMSSFSINEAIKDMVDALKLSGRRKSMVMILDLDPKNPMVSADREKIQQVIYNLIDNAIKFSNPKTSIQVSTKTKGERTFVTVTDHGIGMSPEQLPRIWNRFYMADPSRNGNSTGSGLGLAIVKEIIELHGQDITVKSEPGKGSEFTFSLDKTADIN